MASLDKSIDPPTRKSNASIHYEVNNKAKTPSMAKTKHMGSIKERIKKEFGVELQLND